MRFRKSIQTRNRVIAIDPGFDRVGVAVLDNNGVLYSCCIETDRKLPHERRLLDIGQSIKVVIKKWKPQALAIENLFFNQNTSTALRVSEARGVIIYEAVQAGLEICEYGPQEIKIAVTGYGKANKRQMESMVKKLVKLPLSAGKRLDDEIDAIAVGITHLATKKGI